MEITSIKVAHFYSTVSITAIKLLLMKYYIKSEKSLNFSRFFVDISCLKNFITTSDRWLCELLTST